MQLATSVAQILISSWCNWFVTVQDLQYGMNGASQRLHCQVALHGLLLLFCFPRGISRAFTYACYRESRSVHHSFMLDTNYSYVAICIFYGAFHCWLKKFFLTIKKKVVC